MAYASRSGRARTSSRSPAAHAICDRCGFRYNHSDLQWQYEFAGAGLQNLRILVCNRCLDVPQNQLRAIVIPADPIPIINPRPEAYANDETDFPTLTPSTIDPVTGIPIPNTTTMTTSSADQFSSAFSNAFATMAPYSMTMQPVGSPLGYTQNSQSPLVLGMNYGVKLSVISIIAAGTTIITVTTSTVHGLSVNSQVALQGVLTSNASGVYSVQTVNSPTQFTYQTNTVIPAGSLLTSHTLVTTMNMGLPMNYPQVPQTGT